MIAWIKYCWNNAVFVVDVICISEVKQEDSVTLSIRADPHEMGDICFIFLDNNPH